MALSLVSEATPVVASFNHKQHKEIEGNYLVTVEDSFLILLLDNTLTSTKLTINDDLPVGAVISAFQRNPNGKFNFQFIGSEEIESTQLTNEGYKAASLIKVSATKWKFLFAYSDYPSTAALEKEVKALLALVAENSDSLTANAGKISDLEELLNEFEATTQEFRNSISSDVAQLNVEVAENFTRFGELSDEITALAGLTSLQNRDILAYSAQERLSREQADTDILKSIADSAAARSEMNRRRMANERLIDAVVYIDPENGEIINRAFQYTDEYFTQASLRIDGVEGEINAAVERIDLSEDEIENLYSELSLLPGVITATAQSVVAQNIGALTPAHSFNFFDSAQGWIAEEGTLTEVAGYITVTQGDISNSSLAYNGRDNPAIRIQCKRVAGAGFLGNLIVTFADTTQSTISGVIPNDLVEGSYTYLIVDLDGYTDYEKDITGLRIQLGEDTNDVFDIKGIEIGKKDALLQEFNALTGRVTEAEVKIDAIEGEIVQKVDVTTFNNEAVTRSNVSSVLDGVNSYIELKALNQTLTDNDTVTKANAAAVEIDALENTITQSVETFTSALESTDAQVTSALQQISDLKVRQQVISVSKTAADYEQDTALLADLAKTSLRDYLLNTRSKTAALAISDLEVEISPEGSIGKRITDLESVSNQLDNLISANLREIQIVSTNLDGTAQAAQQLELEVTDLQDKVEANITEISSVKIDSKNNTEAITGLSQTVSNNQQTAESSINQINNTLVELDDALNTTSSALSVIEGKVNNGTTGLEAAYTTAQQAKTASNGNTSSITSINNRLNNNETGLEATADIAQSAKSTADGANSSITTINNRLNNSTTGLNALSESIQGVSQDLDDTISALNSVTNKVNHPTTGNSALSQTIQGVKATADGNTSSINSLSTRVADNENFASSQLQLNASYDSSLNALVSRAYLGTDSNGRVAGIDINNNGSFTSINFKADALKLLDNSNVAKVYFDTTNNRYVFKGHIEVDSGYFKGKVEAAEIVGGTMNGTTINGVVITGSTVRTASSGYRAELKDDGTYMFWIGNGTKNDANGIFWIKKNGTGYVKGSFFSGGIIESKISSGTRTASHTHNSAGNDVEVTVNASGSSTTIAGSAPSGVGTTTYTRTIAIKRAGVIIKSIEAVVTRVVEYEAAEREYTTRDFFSFSTSFVDTGTSNTGYVYRVDVDAMPLSGASQEVTLKTYENILG